MQTTLLYIASGVILLWGGGHLMPTRNVVAGFGTLSPDNTRIITMEWIAEGLTLIFLGVLVLLVTITAGPQDPTAVLVIRSSAAMLLVLAVLSALTGARRFFGS